MKDCHVVIAGGGPAGLAAATGFARRGLSVLLVERRSYPIDKTCGEGIQPPGIAALRRLGVLEKIPSDAKSEIKGIAYFSGTTKACAEFAEGPGLGVRRTALSQVLRDTAVASGVIIVRGDVRDLLPDYMSYSKSGELPALQIRTRLVVGADGLHSFVRRWCGLDDARRPYHRFGMRRHFGVPEELVPQFVEVHAGNLCEAYVTPVGKGRLQIAFLWHREKFAATHNVYDSLLSEFPSLSKYAKQPLDRASGYGPLYHETRGVCAQGVILAGDAGGYVDAATGEGISLALEAAEAAIRLSRELGGSGPPVSTVVLSEYAAAYRRVTANYKLTTRWILRISKRPAIARRVIAYLGRRPRLMQVLLSVNMGTRRPVAALVALLKNLF